jgi:plasmid maintenance system antidote protein VapI
MTEQEFLKYKSDTRLKIKEQNKKIPGYTKERLVDSYLNLKQMYMNLQFRLQQKIRENYELKNKIKKCEV